MNTRGLFESIIDIIYNYNEMAKSAIKVGEGVLFVPGMFNLETFKHLCLSPQIVSNGGGSKEPCYLSLEDANIGRNADGTPHNGYLILDPIDRKIISVIDRNGIEQFQINESGSDSERESIPAMWCGDEIHVTDRSMQKYVLKTIVGLRGMCNVTVIKLGDDWTVITDEGYDVQLSSITKE